MHLVKNVFEVVVGEIFLVNIPSMDSTSLPWIFLVT
jgi:hypothetical protein